MCYPVIDEDLLIDEFHQEDFDWLVLHAVTIPCPADMDM